MKPSILSDAQIEADAYHLIAKYARKTGKSVTLPVPIERIIDSILDIPIEWEPIPPKDGREVVSKIVQPTYGKPSRIVMNEAMLGTKFAECPGLEATGMGHEAGHATYHIDRSKQFQLALDLDETAFHTTIDEVSSELQRRLRQFGPMGDDWWREWQAHTFMRHILMPEHLILPLVQGISRLTWPALYEMRETCNVTISALVVHLCKRGYMQVEERTIRDLRVGSGGQIHLSRR